MHGVPQFRKLSERAKPFEGRLWRVVELQSQSVTMRLCDSIEDQALLENILDDTKPLVPPECDGLHYLLSTPFRYEPYPFGSRFRRAHQREGVFYGALEEETAIAETAFYTLLFFLESPDTTPPRSDLQRTSFQVACKTQRAIDITKPPFARHRKEWEDLNIYSACQKLADDARNADIELILYRSVRDHEKGLNGAILSPSVFARKAPYETSQHTWRLFVSRDSIRAVREFPKLTLTFERSLWADDLRVV